jgi:RimJ/RimL family protein N-acetyltransferase
MQSIYPIETSRLKLQPFIATDLDALYLMESDPVVKRFTGGPLTREETAQLLQSFISMVAETGLGAISIKLKESGRLVGLCGLYRASDADSTGGECELFFGLAQVAWGKGYATEAGHALIVAGFQQLGFQRIIATVHPDNARSIQVLERLGMQCLGSKIEAETGDHVLVYKIERK